LCTDVHILFVATLKNEWEESEVGSTAYRLFSAHVSAAGFFTRGRMGGMY
jgi:hypothetical protein